MPSVFVIRGFGKKQDSKGNSIDFEQVHQHLIEPAIEACNLSGGTTEIIEDAGNIRADMFELIIQADVVICDISIHNANVFYELGIRHSLRKKHTVLIKGSSSADRTPFDVATDRYLKYDSAAPAASLNALVDAIKASIHSIRPTDSPVFLMLPTLPEADPAHVTATPLDLMEEIERAQAVSDQAWLRVIAQDLLQQRFETEGLRRVGKAQWKLEDFDGARETWEKIRQVDSNDYDANSALANIYERQYRQIGNDELLTLSQQAIDRVLDSPLCTNEQRAEMLALRGRNLKTIWREPIEASTDIETALKEANSRVAIESYESYSEAFECDLNAYYAGITSLQMMHLLLLLANQEHWKYLFSGDTVQADQYKDKLNRELPALTHVVKAAIKRDLRQSGKAPSVWAKASHADLLLLELPDDEPEHTIETLKHAYKDSLPENDKFASSASIGQLELFAHLGYKFDIVRALIDEFKAPSVEQKKEHLVIFAGHTFDKSGMQPRFPASAESDARILIRDAIFRIQESLAKDEYMTVLASAAPGADILLHEVCKEHGISTYLCLPTSTETVASEVFAESDELRNRFFNIVKSNEQSILQMAVQDDLPGWLKNREGIDIWERGNRWVMEMAKSSGASRVIVLAFWDGVEDEATGGTSQLVKLARSIGQFHIEVIDSKQLLSSAG